MSLNKNQQFEAVRFSLVRICTSKEKNQIFYIKISRFKRYPKRLFRRDQ